MVNSINFSLQLKDFLFNILNTDMIKLDLLHELRGKYKFGEINIKEEKSHYKLPIGIKLGVFLLNEEEKSEIINEIQVIVLDNLKANLFTNQGIINCFILIYRIGNLHDSEQNTIAAEISKFIQTGKLIELLQEFITQLNIRYKVKYKLKEPLDVKEWRELVNSFSYFTHFDDPAEILYNIIYLNKDRIDILSLLHLLKPEPRAFLTYYRIYNLINKTDKEIQEFLRLYPEENVYVTFLLLNSQENLPWINQIIIDDMIQNRWETSGKWIFRYLYSFSFNVNENIRTIAIDRINTFFQNQFSNDNLKSTIINNFEWPEDFYALGGWLESTLNENKIDLSDTFINEMAIASTNAFINIKNNVRFYFSNTEVHYSEWFSDPYEKRTQYITTYLLFSILNCDDEVFEELTKSFKNLCYNLKTMLYGSYQSIHLTKITIHRLLLLLTSLPKDNQTIKTTRLHTLMNVMNDSFLYPWIRLVEREEIIWNYDNYEPNFMIDSELHMLIKRLSDTYDSNNEKYFKILFDSINNYSTIKWPIFITK